MLKPFYDHDCLKQPTLKIPLQHVIIYKCMNQQFGIPKQVSLAAQHLCLCKTKIEILFQENVL